MQPVLSTDEQIVATFQEAERTISPAPPTTVITTRDRDEYLACNAFASIVATQVRRETKPGAKGSGGG